MNRPNYFSHKQILKMGINDNTQWAVPKIFLKLLTFLVFSAFFRIKLFYLQNSQKYTELSCFLDIKLLTQQVKGSGAVAGYCSGGRSTKRS